MKYQLQKFTDKELLKIFPEAKDIIPKKISECKKEIKKKELEIATALENIYALKTDSFSEWFGEEIIKTFMTPDLIKLEKNLFRLNHLKYLCNPNSPKNESFAFQEKIESARKYPIEELARSKLNLRQVGRNFVSLCPLHDEKTPSFYIYTETNRFCCFGCQEKGDVIKLSMALYGVGFRDAVMMLNMI